MSPKINNNLDLITARTDIKKRPNKMMTDKEENNNLFYNDIKNNINQNSIFKKENNKINNNENNNIKSIHNILKESIDSKKENKNNQNNNNNNLNYEEENIQIVSNQNYIEKIKIIYSYSPKLNLEILNSITYHKGLIIKLDAFGMIENSLRNKRDDFTYFGFIEDKKKEIDFLIQPKENYY